MGNANSGSLLQKYQQNVQHPGLFCKRGQRTIRGMGLHKLGKQFLEPFRVFDPDAKGRADGVKKPHTAGFRRKVAPVFGVSVFADGTVALGHAGGHQKQLPGPWGVPLPVHRQLPFAGQDKVEFIVVRRVSGFSPFRPAAGQPGFLHRNCAGVQKLADILQWHHLPEFCINIS